MGHGAAGPPGASYRERWGTSRRLGPVAGRMPGVSRSRSCLLLPGRPPKYSNPP
ncbi:hypothetical protein BD626DRAFT_484358 [Schizophyllum amplum]|uniref:Uncharacterized protein n=1 Tax=Schizophyllum amplum TaxID=97359 RepID=A0A550CQ94_9AGAR|nr:hypothetical protein BD626DRAFT_484358 [Auriculariopsis ampla]